MSSTCHHEKLAIAIMKRGNINGSDVVEIGAACELCLQLVSFSRLRGDLCLTDDGSRIVAVVASADPRIRCPRCGRFVVFAKVDGVDLAAAGLGAFIEVEHCGPAHCLRYELARVYCADGRAWKAEGGA